MPPAVAAVAMSLMATILLVAHPASAQTDTDSCAAGGAVSDAANNPGLVSDCDALLAARDTLAGTATLNWSASTPIGQWEGVSATGSPLRVTRLYLRGKGLTGEVPSELASLTNMQRLNLSLNQLTGGIPAELDGLSDLQLLDLSWNQLSGPIPGSLGGLSNLGWLYLFDNQLSGKIPTELGNLSNLQLLSLERNQLTGPIPAELGGLSNLKSLILYGNQLTGRIPAELGSLNNLEYLLLALNQLSGCVPEGLREVADNDLDELGLPYCDVLLSGLTVSPGWLVPAFDPYRTDYSASVGLAPVTVTVIPANDHGATFQFLNDNDLLLVDADNTLEGFQVEFGVGVPAIKIRVVSQDKLATHTYAITDLGNRYDANDDSVIQRDEVISAIKDYFNGLITREETIEVIKLYFSSPPSPSEMINALAWVKDGTTASEERGVELLNDLASSSLPGFRALMRKPWIRDDLTSVEIEVVSEFRRLAYRSGAQADELILQILDMPFLESIESTDDDVTRILVRAHLEEPGGLPEFLADPRLNSWITDASAGVVLLIGLEQEAPEAGASMWAQPWIVDGITKDEVQFIGKLVLLAYWDLPFALAAAEYFDVQKGDLAYLVIESLSSLWPYQDAADRLKAQPWFADGLDDDEAALVVTLYGVIYTSPELYNNLLDAPYTQHKTVSVPLAGDVNIWVIGNTLPPSDEDLLTIIEDTVRITEEFLGVAFPTTDVILLVVEEYTVDAGHYGTHMVLYRSYGEVYSVPHETAHYYLHYNIGQFWLREGGAQFAEAYVNDQTGVRDLEDRKSDLIYNLCDDNYENIRHLNYLYEHIYRFRFGGYRPLPCHYVMGEYFLLNIFEAIGKEAMSVALKELYLSNTRVPVEQ